MTIATKTPLCELAERYRTDKVPSIYHNYTPYYHELFGDRRQEVRRVLEIGIGYPETMMWGPTEGYVIGASLYMWRDYFPNAEIVVLDNKLDKLETFHRANRDSGRFIELLCDQSVASDLQRVAETLSWGQQFDLIVDDGSHVAEHQVLSAKLLYSLLAPGGVYVIEDVPHSDLVTKKLPFASEVKTFDTNTGDDRLVVIRKPKGEEA